MKWGTPGVDWQERINFARLREDRVTRAQKMLEKHGIGTAIIFNHDSMRYLGAPWEHSYRRALPVKFILFIRGAGFPYCPINMGLEFRPPEDCPWLKDRLVGYDVLSQPDIIRMRPLDDTEERWKKTVQEMKSLMKKHGVADLPVSVDYGSAPLFKALKDAGLTVVDGNPWIMEADVVKLDDEIELMKMAAACNEAGWAALVREFRPGMRECDAMAIMSKAIFMAGAEHIGGWVINSGPRACPRSFNYTDRIVRPGEFLGAEAVEVNYCGYKVCYDRTFLVGGKPTDLQKEVYYADVDLQHRAERVIKPGMTTHELMVELRKGYEGYGYMMLPIFKDVKEVGKFRKAITVQNHFGGMGIRYDGAPDLTAGEPEIVLEKNMVFALHLCLAAEAEGGGVGVSIENNWRVTEKGVENICNWPYDDIMVIGE